MTARKLFFMRLIEEWRFQWGVLNTVVDWTILVYLIIPTLIAIPIVYLDIWHHIDFYWPSFLPLSFLLELVSLVSVRGHVRTFLKEADLLQVVQIDQLVGGLKCWSFLYSLIKLIIGQLVIFVMVYPVLRLHFELSDLQILCLFLMFCAFRLSAWTIKKVMDRTFVKWIIIILLILATLLVLVKTPLYTAGCVGILINVGLLFLYFTKLLRTHALFLREIEIEDQERIKYIKLIISFSMEVAKTTPIKKHQPFVLFPKSMRLFRKRTKLNGLTEILIKAFLRNRNYMVAYLRYLVILCSGTIFLPFEIRVPVYFMILIGINLWLKAIYKSDLLGNLFFSVVPVDETIKDEASIKSRRLLLVPFVLFMLILSVVRWFH